MFIIYKSYKNSIPATCISLLSVLSLLAGLLGLISFFTGGMKYPSNIVWGIVLIALWYGLRKLAEVIAKKKG